MQYFFLYSLYPYPNAHISRAYATVLLPPSTPTICPVTQPCSFPRSHMAALATSSPSPTLPIGWLFSMPFLTASLDSMPSDNALVKRDGATQLTRTFGLSSAARVRVMPSIAPLEADIDVWFENPCPTATELKSTTEPEFFFRVGRRGWRVESMPVTLRSNVERRSSGMTRENGFKSIDPTA